MNKYTEIHPNGQRAYQFVADTAYVRESGTRGSTKTEYILRKRAGSSPDGKVCLHSDTPHGIFPVSGFSAEKGRAGNLPAL